MIGLCLLIGKTIAATINGLPGSLYGLLLFTGVLHFKIVSADKTEQTIAWLISHMGICFVPAGVGIINHFNLLKTHGITIVAIIFFTTFLLLSIVGLWFEHATSSEATSKAKCKIAHKVTTKADHKSDGRKSDNSEFPPS